MPEGIPNDKEGDVDLVSIFENVVARRFNHLAVGYNDGAAIKCFLLP